MLARECAVGVGRDGKPVPYGVGWLLRCRGRCLHRPAIVRCACRRADVGIRPYDLL